jgi:hypothetical protein
MTTRGFEIPSKRRRASTKTISGMRKKRKVYPPFLIQLLSSISIKLQFQRLRLFKVSRFFNKINLLIADVQKSLCYRKSSSKVNFDPKNLIKQGTMKLETLYEFCGKLGKGSYGEVLKLRCKASGELRACKCFLKSKYKADKISVIKNEVEILKMMDHPNVVKVYDYYEDDENFNIVMEY